MSLILCAACSGAMNTASGIGGGTSSPSQTPSPIVSTPISSTFIYRASSTNDQISFASVDLATGSMAEHPSFALVNGAHPVSLAVRPDHRFMYVGNSGTNKISILSLDSTTGVPTLLASTSTSAAPIQLLMDPSGRFLFCLQYSDIVSYTIDSSTGALSFAGDLPITGGVAIAVDPAGKWLYHSATGSGINSYSVDQTTGFLSSPGTMAAIAANALKVNPTTTRMFGPSYSNSNILSYAVDPVAGGLTFTRFVSTPVMMPYTDLVFDAAGTHLYLLGNYLGIIDAYSVDNSTGQLAYLNGVTLPSGCLPKSLTLLPGGNSVATACTAATGSTFVYGLNIDGSLNAGSVQTTLVPNLTADSVISFTY